MNDTPQWLREFRAALKVQNREAIAQLKAALGTNPEEHGRALVAIIAMMLPRRR